jgi:hypothetical protein
MRGFARVFCALAAATGAAAASCTGGLPPLAVAGVLSPPPSCVYTARIAGPFVSTGLIDLAFRREYTPTLLVTSRLIPATDPACAPDRIEAVVALEGATVRITDADGNELDDYTTTGAGLVSASAPAAYETKLVSDTAANQLGTFSGTKRVIAHVKVFGRTTCNAQGYESGSRVESDELTFAIDACIGCLVTSPPDADDPTAAVQPNCDSLTPPSSSPCVLGQDQLIDCRLTR